MFPDRRPEDRIASLWDAINHMCRLDQPDPVAAWQTHIEELAARADYLNQRHYSALRYTGPETDLTIGLPAAHVWVSGHTISRSGIRFTANLPTEEVFTIPHKDRVDGTVRSSKPLSYGGTLIEDFSLRFSEGRVVEVKAARGEARPAATGRDGPGRGAAGRNRARPAQLAGVAIGTAVLQHALRRERRHARGARRGVQVHAARRRIDG